MKFAENKIYDRSTIRVIAVACIAIVVAVIFSGITNYWITRTAVIEKLKKQDFVYIVETLVGKVDNRIEIAKETGALLASDRLIYDWFMSDERDDKLGAYAKWRIADTAARSSYANVSLVNGRTGHYWTEKSLTMGTLACDVSQTEWFPDSVKNKPFITVAMAYDSIRQDKFIFVDILVGGIRNPIGVASIGLDLRELENEFNKYKIGEQSDLWLIADNGDIYISDDGEAQGRNLRDFLPEDIVNRITSDQQSEAPQVLEYKDLRGKVIDIAYQPTKSTGWKLVFQMPRSENTVLLDQIRLNLFIASTLILAIIVFIFYFISYKVSNPLKRAILLADEMKRQVDIRTKELAEKNQQVMDSIEYAQRLQKGILPANETIADTFADVFVLWRPRDLVGGDLYWLRRQEGSIYIAIMDCTGHGVPGALMTMSANAVLRGVLDQGYRRPSEILLRMHQDIQNMWQSSGKNIISDNGLDLALCKIDNDVLVYAGARLPLYIKRAGEVQMIKADRSSIGYQKTESPVFTDYVWQAEPEDEFYLASDGILDQNGGEKNYSFGRTRFMQILTEDHAAMTDVKASLLQSLQDYKGEEPQRDDITVVGFQLRITTR